MVFRGMAHAKKHRREGHRAPFSLSFLRAGPPAMIKTPDLEGAIGTTGNELFPNGKYHNGR